MRVTQQMMAGNMLANINQLRARQSSLSDQISSGDRITRVSEDVTAGTEVMRIQHKTQSLKQWRSNLSDAKSWVYATEAKLGDLADILVQAKDLALDASNGTVSDETRKSLAPAAENLLTDLMNALNEKEPNGFLFGGFQTQQQTDPVTGDRLDAFTLDDVTGQVTYNGDSGVMQRELGPRVTLDVNIPGSMLLNDADPDNVVRALWELKTALKTPVPQDADNDGQIDTDTNGDGIVDADANGDLYIDEDVDGVPGIDSPTANSKLMPQPDAGLQNRITSVLAKLDKARQHVVSLRSEMGARQMRIEGLETRIQDTEVQLEEALQQAQGVDMAKALMELSSAETTYRAALQVGGRILPQSLADFLR
ncbi:MAG TPA: flagellin [Symbiobacteriaceae bacterium]|nr:flagellin [Symbiobacteriaceae bacterium]